jgi:DNA repair protein RadC
LDTAQAIFDFWQSIISSKPDFETEKENLVAILLDTKLRPKGYHLVALGSLNECTAHQREIFRPVIVHNSFAFILAHNHPSGIPDPSDADRRLTAALRDGAALLQINLIDHLVIGSPGSDHPPFYSFRNAGLL